MNKVTGISTSLLETQLILPCVKQKENTIQQNFKIPKHAWQTINDILGRNNNQSVIHEIKYSGKSVTSNEELKEIFNEYFTNIGPKLAQTIEHDSACNFEDFFTKRNVSPFINFLLKL